MPRYKEIFETLKAEIRIGKFGVGCSFPSERALMRRFSVARETIRHAIEELRKQNLIEARQGTMNVLTFRARERATGTFGVIVPDAYYPFYSRISAGIEHFAKRTKEGAFTLLSADLGSGGRPSQASRALEFAEVCIREKVCGVFLRPTSPSFFSIVTSFLRRAKCISRLRWTKGCRRGGARSDFRALGRMIFDKLTMELAADAFAPAGK